MTDNRLMTPQDLIEVTGKTRYSKQVAWFKARFNIDVTQRDDGSIVLAWATYLALDAKKSGLSSPASGKKDFELCFD